MSCGEFEDDRGAKYLIIVNRNVNEPVEITPRLQWERIDEITVYDRERCAWADAPAWRAGEERLPLKLAPGDAVFVRATLTGR